MTEPSRTPNKHREKELGDSATQVGYRPIWKAHALEAYQVPWLNQEIQQHVVHKPQEKKRGRRVAPDVAKAMVLQHSIDLAHIKKADRWRLIYPLVIENLPDMNESERRDAQNQLRKRVRDNERNARKRAEK